VADLAIMVVTAPRVEDAGQDKVAGECVRPAPHTSTAAPVQHTAREGRHAGQASLASSSGSTAKPILTTATGPSSHRLSANISTSWRPSVLTSQPPPTAQ